MGRVDPSFLVVGFVTRPHGIKGELLVSPLTDHPDGTYVPGVVVLLGDRDAEHPDPDAPPLRIAAARPYKGGVLVSFGGVDSRDAAESLQGRYLLRARDELAPLEEGEVFYHELLGMTVETVDGRILGEVVEVYELFPSDLLDVRGGEGSYMIPFRDGVVVDVDTGAGRMVVDPPEGLLDL